MRTILTLALMCATTVAARAEKPDDLWSIAEARVIAERCKAAKVDERAVAAMREAARIDLKENEDDREQYAFLVESRRDMLWVKSDDAVCLRGHMLYGPGAWPRDRLLIYDPSWK